METAKTKPFNYRLAALGGMPKIKGGVIAESLLYFFGNNNFVIVKGSLLGAGHCEKAGDAHMKDGNSKRAVEEYAMAVQYLEDAKEAVSPYSCGQQGQEKYAPTLHKRILRKMWELNCKISDALAGKNTDAEYHADHA